MINQNKISKLLTPKNKNKNISELVTLINKQKFPGY